MLSGLEHLFVPVKLMTLGQILGHWAASHGFAEFRLFFMFCLLLHSVPYTVNALHITVLDPDLSSVLLTTLCENKGLSPCILVTRQFL